LITKTPQKFIAACHAIENEGWRARNLVEGGLGCAFDTNPELSVLIDAQALEAWCHRYKGQNLRRIPELVKAMKAFLNPEDTRAAVERMERLVRAENDWIDTKERARFYG
jgi:hypothetical protein